MCLRLSIFTFFIYSFASFSQGSGLGCCTIHPGDFEPPSQPPASSGFHNGRMTILRHGYREDARIYDEHGAHYWERFARSPNFALWNPPLAADQSILINSISRLLTQNPNGFHQIVVSPMRRTIDTLRFVIIALRLRRLPIPHIIIEQRLREWPHASSGAPFTPIPFTLQDVVYAEAGTETPPTIFEKESISSDRNAHQRRVLGTLSEYAHSERNVLVIGHLDTVYAADPVVYFGIQTAEMGGYITLRTDNRSLGALLDEHLITR